MIATVRRGCVSLHRRLYCLPQWVRVLGSFPVALVFGQALNLSVRQRWGLS